MIVYTLCVGQGSLSVVVGDEEAIIVDSFIPPSTADYAVFVKKALSIILQGRKVIGLVLTGFDRDHAHPTGIAWILRKYYPNWIMYPCYRKDTQTADEVFDRIARINEQRRGSPAALHKISIRLDRMWGERIFGGLSKQWDIEVFSPHVADMVSSNNSSLVAKIVPKKHRNHNFTYLITGDTENPRWESISYHFGDRIQADVLAAPHHGSSNSMNHITLLQIAPRHVLISAGVGNQFDHPRDDVWELYRLHSCRVFSTHLGSSLATYIDRNGYLQTVPIKFDE